MVVGAPVSTIAIRRCPPVIAKISNNLDRADASWFYRFFYRIRLRILGLVIDHFVGTEKPMRAEIVHGIGVAPARVAIIPAPALSEAQIVALRTPGEARPRAASSPSRGWPRRRTWR